MRLWRGSARIFSRDGAHAPPISSADNFVGKDDSFRRFRSNGLLQLHFVDVSRSTFRPALLGAHPTTSKEKWTKSRWCRTCFVAFTNMVRSSPRVALLESRMSGELARLVEKHGGMPLCVPAVRERREIDDATAERLMQGLSSGAHEIVVFMTGVAVSLLFEIAERRGRRPDLVSGLRGVTTVCRGPKPTAALRGFGVVPTLTARDSFTSAQVIDALSSIDLKDKRVLLFHYGERSDTLAETLIARQAVLDEQWLYRWELPEDTSGLDRLVAAVVRGEVDALAITCQIQFRHLFEVANRLGQARDLVDALNQNVVVAAVGPTCHAILRRHGVRVEVVPEHPKMGPLVVALMRYLERKSGPRPSVGATDPGEGVL